MFRSSPPLITIDLLVINIVVNYFRRNYRTFVLTVFKAFRSAPLAISISAITTLLDKQAMCNGVLPFCQHF